MAAAGSGSGSSSSGASAVSITLSGIPGSSSTIAADISSMEGTPSITTDPGSAGRSATAGAGTSLGGSSTGGAVTTGNASTGSGSAMRAGPAEGVTTSAAGSDQPAGLNGAGKFSMPGIATVLRAIEAPNTSGGS